MSCNPRDYEQENRVTKLPKTGKWKKAGATLVTALCMFCCAVYISSLWLDDNSGDVKETAKNWEQARGNDGKFWKGTPDNSIYADMEGVRCYRYDEYYYDVWGRLSAVDTFRPHDYYEDTWVLSEKESYKYDSRGRISRRSTEGRSETWNYQYTKDGYTLTRSIKNAGDDIYMYDTENNLVFSRIAVTYRYAHETSFEYDEKNRLIREILEIEGEPAYVLRTIEYDDESHTSLETEYADTGAPFCISFNTYDEEWKKTGSVWYRTEDIPTGMSPEDCEEYYTQGYWVTYSDGLLTEELTNKLYSWSTTRIYSLYKAYNYDENGNCVFELSVWDAEAVYINRYVYDDENRLIEHYEYDADDMMFWEEVQPDGNLLTVVNDGEGTLKVTRRTPEGTLVNEFVFGEDNVQLQYTLAETIDWQTSPAQIMAEKEQEEPEDSEKEPFITEKRFYYTVEQGDTLWHIAECYLGNGQSYRELYEENEEIIGDNPGLIFPGMKLYIDIE